MRCPSERWNYSIKAFQFWLNLWVCNFKQRLTKLQKFPGFSRHFQQIYSQSHLYEFFNPNNSPRIRAVVIWMIRNDKKTFFPLHKKTGSSRHKKNKRNKSKHQRIPSIVLHASFPSNAISITSFTPF